MDEFSMRAPSRKASMKPLLLAVGGSFALGAGAAGYIAWTMAQSDSDAVASAPLAAAPSPQVSPQAATSPAPAPSSSATRAANQQAVEQMAEQQGGIDQRLAAAEQRLSRLDLQAQAAAGNAARAEGLLIAFAIRRTVAKGAELGYLADQLRLRFGDALPNATNTILTFSRDPVTLDQLIARLDGLAPQLQSGADRDGFQRFTEELGALFTVRRESTPSPQPRMRIERARQFLASGRIDSAIAEVRNMPGAANAQGWLRDAERYAAMQRALDLIETAAILEPRRLRDGAGNSIAQPSPIEE